MCNLQKCDDSIWEGKNSHWTSFGDLTDCDSNELKSRALQTVHATFWTIISHTDRFVDPYLSQDIAYVTLAVENVKVMNAKIVAKINQDRSEISMRVL